MSLENSRLIFPPCNCSDSDGSAILSNEDYFTQRAGCLQWPTKLCIASALLCMSFNVLAVHTHPAQLSAQPHRTEGRNWSQTPSHLSKLLALLTISHSILFHWLYYYLKFFIYCLSPSLEAKIQENKDLFFVSLTAISPVPRKCLAYCRSSIHSI